MNVPGEPLPARFAQVERLGAGAHGDVFRARDLRDGGEVAIKRLRRLDVGSLVRFKREFRALADLRHPNLAGLHELSYDGGRWLLTMEHVSGRDLRAHCGDDPARWIACLPGLGAGLTALHEAGYLHRDLHAHNARVTAQGRVVLLDFGLASPSGRKADSFSSAMATAPEQVAGEELGPASDWYAAGVLLYQGLAGAPPFTDARGPQILARKLREDAPSIRTRRADLPPSLAALVDALLMRDPRERMRTAAPLIAELAEITPAAADAEHDSLPFVGRDAELELLRAQLDDACARAAVVHVRVHGPSGIGKSSLIERFSESARDARVWWGRCFENEAVPYAGLDAIVDQLPRGIDEPSHEDEGVERDARAALAAMFPVLARGRVSTGDAGDARDAASAPIDLAEALRRAASALSSLLARASEGRVPVVVIDDAQWGDEDTARLLARVSAGPLLVVTVVRDGEIDRGLVASLDALRPPARTIALRPLGLEDVARLAARRGRGDADAIYRQTEGLPLFVVEMVRGAHAESLEDALATRVAALPAAERALLLGMAVAARPLDRPLAFEVAAQLGATHPYGALAGLRGGRLVRLRHAERGTRLELAHASLGQAAIAVLSRGAAADTGIELTRVHAILDDAMGALEIDDPEVRAGHARAAGRRERALVLLDEAARRASATFAFERAARIHGDILALGPSDPAAVHRARGEALAAAGRGAEAAAEFADALRGRAPDLAEPETIELARLEVEHLFHAGRLEDGYTALQRVVAAAGLPFPSPRGAVASVVARQLWLRARGIHLARRTAPTDARTLARIELAHALGTALANVDSFRAADYVTRALVLALSAGDARSAGRSLAFVAAHASSRGTRGAPHVRRMIVELERLTAQTGDGYLLDVTDAVRCLLLFHTGAYRESLALASACEEIFRGRVGTVRERVTAQIYQCASLAMLGSFSALEVQRRRLVEDAEARGDRFGTSNGASGLMNVGWLVAGDPARARREADEAIGLWSDRTFTVQHAFDLIAQSRIDLYVGEPERALARLLAARPRLTRSLLFRMPFVRVHVLDLVARAHLLRASRGREESGDLGRAARLSSAIRREHADCYEPYADALDGAIAMRRGDARRAVVDATRARERYRALGMAAHAALADRLVGACGGGAAGLELEPVADPDAFARALAPVAAPR